jgi:Resolvase, N terminal domain
VLLVTRLDRLARSTGDLLNTLDAIGKAGAGFRSLADAWADTTTPHGRLMLTVLGGLAEFERELIKARTEEGRKRAFDLILGRTSLERCQTVLSGPLSILGESAAPISRRRPPASVPPRSGPTLLQ